MNKCLARKAFRAGWNYRGRFEGIDLFAEEESLGKEAAFEQGAAPITLIDGQRLIDLMLEHEIGVSKRKIELLEIEPSAFTMQQE